MNEIAIGKIWEVKEEKKPGPLGERVRTLVDSGRILSIPRDNFGHCHVRGMTGSGKSSLSLTKLLGQFMQPTENGERDPIFVFDMGGDPNLFYSTSELAKRHGRTFRYLTLDEDLKSFSFSPFQAIPQGKRNLLHIAQLLIAALHMDHGLVYGGQYFSQQNLGALLRVARQLAKDNRTATLEDISRYLDDPRNRMLFRDAEQVRMTFSFLLEYPQLKPASDPRMEIDVNRAIENSEVIYFFTPTLQEPITAPIVAGLGLYTLLNICIRRSREAKSHRNVRVCIDEFQDLVGRSLSRFLAQCRKFGLKTAILSNQSTQQLETKDISLSHQVFENCMMRQYFTSLGDDLKVLQSLSDTVMDVTTGMSQGRMLSASVSHSQREVPGLHANTIREVTDRFGFSLVSVNDGQGHRNPIIVSQVHESPDYSRRPMPRRPVSAPTTTADPNVSPERVGRLGALQSLWERIDGEIRVSRKES